jgi:phosphohistidine phosphatase
MVWLLRHGEAVDGRPDEQRQLTDEGVRQATAAGLALARLDAHVDVCLCSPKVRALQTAQRACEPLGVAVTVDRALAGEAFDARALTAGLGDVLLVGHDPSLSRAVHDLTGARAKIKKGGLVGISSSELVALLRPADLAAIAYAEERIA